MKRAYLITALTVGAIAVTSTVAMARMGGPGHGDMPRGPRINFEEVDANSDGKITQEELAAYAKARFEAADTDGNGRLSAEEMQARMESEAQSRMKERMAAGAKRMIERRDANDDGELSLEEVAPRNGDRMFTRLDADNDGAISTEEFAKIEKMRKKGGQRHKH